MNTVESPTFDALTFTPLSMRQVVGARREIKHNGSDVNLGGRKGRELDDLLNQVQALSCSLELAHRPWVEEKMQVLSLYFSQTPTTPKNGDDHLLSGNWRSFVREKFSDGLITTLTQEYRVLRKHSEGRERLQDPAYLQGVITAYTFDFYRTLRVSQRLGINPKVATGIAKLSYHFDPNKLIDLTSRYKDLNPSVIERAALNYPKDSEGFLDNFIASIKRLGEDSRYKDLNPSVIERAALNYPKDPEGFLDNFIGSEHKEYFEFWLYLKSEDFVERAIAEKRLTEDEVKILERFFDRNEGVPSKRLFEKLSLAVANLA